MGPFIAYILLLLTARPTGQEDQLGLQLKVCNCTKPIIQGVIDLNKPAFCASHPRNITKEEVKYGIHVKQKNLSWRGYACAQWMAKKEISDNFLLAHDTIFKKSVVAVTPEACWKTTNLQHQCGTNKMEKDGTTYKYLHEATGEGKWLTTQRYTILICFTQEITLYKEEEDGPILSPFGTLTNDSKASYAFHNDLTIVWKTDEAEHPPCTTHSIHSGVGQAITHNKETRFIDKENQVEFHYRQEALSICSFTPVYAVIG